MADITITIPADKLQLIKDWVDSRVSDTAQWTDQQYADYVDIYITSWFRGQMRAFQRGEYMETFVFDDPVT